jgi:hypothetical protein
MTDLAILVAMAFVEGMFHVSLPAGDTHDLAA